MTSFELFHYFDKNGVRQNNWEIDITWFIIITVIVASATWAPLPPLAAAEGSTWSTANFPLDASQVKGASLFKRNEFIGGVQ